MIVKEGRKKQEPKNSVHILRVERINNHNRGGNQIIIHKEFKKNKIKETAIHELVIIN